MKREEIDQLDVVAHNSKAWDQEVKRLSPWTKPMSPEEIKEAKAGNWKLFLTPKKAVPRNWLGVIEGSDILCLAGSGGQQGSLLATLGASVTVYDASPAQLEQDRMVARREQFPILTIQGDIANLSELADESYDLIVHPCSNCFVRDIQPVWDECFRVLRHGGVLLSGFLNPIFYASDRDAQERGEFVIKHSVPYSDLKDLPEDRLVNQIEKNETIEFGHSLESQIGGQIKAGFVITGFFEDYWGVEKLDQFLPQFCATRALKQ